MNIYIDLIAKEAITSPTDSTPAVRPDFRAATTYPINLYFLRQLQGGGYAYVRFPNSSIVAGVRSNAPVEVARFTLMFRGAETSEIDTRFAPDQIRQLLEKLPTIGAGNVSVELLFGSLVVEFVGALAGMVLPSMSARIVSSTPANAELTIDILPVTSNAANSRQQLTLRRPSLASTSTWTEITIGTTPGWTGTLDTTLVPVSSWENPIGDIVLEVLLTALTTRTANDGSTVNDAVGRSGADGQVIASPGTDASGRVADNGNDSFLVASDGDGVYGRKFVPNDIGREITNAFGFLWPSTTIAEVFDNGVVNMARLSQRYTPAGIGLGYIIDYTLLGLPSDVYYSATANWTAADVGHQIVGGNITDVTRIIALIDSHFVRLSQRASAIGVALPWTVRQEVSNVFTSASGVFSVSDVGATLRAPTVLDGDATIIAFISPTQVQLDKRPKATSVSVPWKVIPVRPYPTASVSRLVTGSMSSQEVQKIALAQAATDGTITIQDGYGGSMPLVVVKNPVQTSNLEIALKQAYSNYGDLYVEEVVQGAEWNVTFGKVGGQRLLMVDESQAIYGGAVLNMVVADQVQQSPPDLPAIPAVPAALKYRANGLVYIGCDPAHPNVAHPLGLARVNRATDGTNALILRQRMMNFTDLYTPPAMNFIIGRNGKQFYFVGDEGGSEKNGLYMVDWVAATMPAARIEEHNQQRTIMVPLYQKRGNVILDIQLVSTSTSTFVDVHFQYYLEEHEIAVPPDSPFAVVVHYSTVGGVEFQPTLWSKNGFNTINGNWNIKYLNSWSRRRWMGHIWEQKQFIN